MESDLKRSRTSRDLVACTADGPMKRKPRMRGSFDGGVLMSPADVVDEHMVSDEQKSTIVEPALFKADDMRLLASMISREECDSLEELRALIRDSFDIDSKSRALKRLKWLGDHKDAEVSILQAQLAEWS